MALDTIRAVTSKLQSKETDTNKIYIWSYLKTIIFHSNCHTIIIDNHTANYSSIGHEVNIVLLYVFMIS